MTHTLIQPEPISNVERTSRTIASSVDTSNYYELIESKLISMGIWKQKKNSSNVKCTQKVRIQITTTEYGEHFNGEKTAKNEMKKTNEKRTKRILKSDSYRQTYAHTQCTQEMRKQIRNETK